jgi:hypothetical protein
VKRLAKSKNVGSKRAPSWLPSWTNQTKYPAKASRLDWAWEFLRRNPEYQKLWSQLIAPNYDPRHVTMNLKRTPALAQKVYDRVRTPIKKSFRDYPFDRFRAQFGIISVPLNPSERKARILFATIRYARKPLKRGGMPPGWTYSVPTALQDHEVLVWFDLRRPIEWQLKTAKKVLTEQIKEEKLEGVPFQFRFRPQQYVRYLRLLDAKAAGVKDAFVAGVLYPGIKNTYPDYAGSRKVRDDRKIAERLRHYPWQIAAGGK